MVTEIGTERKASLVEMVGVNNCLTTDSWKIATWHDMEGNVRLTPEDMAFLRGTYCIADEPPEPPLGAALIRTDTPPDIPSPIVLGAVNWFGLEYKNTGTRKWKGYLGIRLTDIYGVTYEFTGDQSYPQTLLAGATGTIWAKVTVPSYLSLGNLEIKAILYSVA